MANRWKLLLLLESKEFKGFVEALFPYSCLFTSVARVIKKINMSYTTILYNGRKELRSYFRLGNVTEILIFKCRQKTRLSQRVMHGIHFLPWQRLWFFHRRRLWLKSEQHINISSMSPLRNLWCSQMLSDVFRWSQDVLWAFQGCSHHILSDLCGSCGSS